MPATAQSSETDHKASISKARAVEKTRSEAVTKAEARLKAQRLEQQRLKRSFDSIRNKSSTQKD